MYAEVENPGLQRTTQSSGTKSAERNSDHETLCYFYFTSHDSIMQTRIWRTRLCRRTSEEWKILLQTTLGYVSLLQHLPSHMCRRIYGVKLHRMHLRSSYFLPPQNCDCSLRSSGSRILMSNLLFSWWCKSHSPMTSPDGQLRKSYHLPPLARAQSRPVFFSEQCVQSLANAY
jgi:hypothetical protein